MDLTIYCICLYMTKLVGRNKSWCGWMDIKKDRCRFLVLFISCILIFKSFLNQERYWDCIQSKKLLITQNQPKFDPLIFFLDSELKVKLVYLNGSGLNSKKNGFEFGLIWVRKNPAHAHPYVCYHQIRLLCF